MIFQLSVAKENSMLFLSKFWNLPPPDPIRVKIFLEGKPKCYVIEHQPTKAPGERPAIDQSQGIPPVKQRLFNTLVDLLCRQHIAFRPKIIFLLFVVFLHLYAALL
jgi:hypothetical protein